MKAWQACTSARVNCGYWSNTASMLMFSVNRPTMVTTGTRVPRTHGTPPTTAGSTTMRSMAEDCNPRKQNKRPGIRGRHG